MKLYGSYVKTTKSQEGNVEFAVRFLMLFPRIINQGKSDASFIFLYLVWKNASRKLHIFGLRNKHHGSMASYSCSTMDGFAVWPSTLW